jgi:hypothetical protein
VYVCDGYGCVECHAVVSVTSLNFKILEACGTVIGFLLHPQSSECFSCCMSLKLFLNYFMNAAIQLPLIIVDCISELFTKMYLIL